MTDELYNDAVFDLFRLMYDFGNAKLVEDSTLQAAYELDDSEVVSVKPSCYEGMTKALEEAERLLDKMDDNLWSVFTHIKEL